jgi:GNAT superfamily N-acetyltransferase
MTTLKLSLRRANELLRKEGIKGFWLKLLGEVGWYRRLLLLERPLPEPIPEIMPRLPITISLLNKTELDEYLEFRPKSNPSRIADRINANHWCFVARHDRLIISASWAATQRAWNFYLGAEVQVAPGDVYVYDSFTMLDFRGQSISPAIRAEMIRYFRAAGYQRMIMGVIPENEPSLRAVLKTGFRPFGTMGWIKIGPWQWDFYRTNKHYD